MATFNQIYDVSAALESAGNLIISASVADVGMPREQVFHSTPAVHIKFLSMKPTGHYQITFDASGSMANARHDAWEGNFVSYVITDRATDNSFHNTYIATVRQKLSDRTQFNKNLPFHQVLYVEEQGMDVGFDQEKNQDQTTISYLIRVCVRPEQWPVGT